MFENIYDDIFEMEEEDLVLYLKEMEESTLMELMEAEEYTFDENESMSRNIRNFAEQYTEYRCMAGE